MKVEFRCALENVKGGAGTVHFDQCGVSQEAFKQHVKNPGFEMRSAANEVSTCDCLSCK